MTPSTWIVVADSARAVIYSLSGRPKGLLPVREMAHPKSRLPSRELVSERPGRSFESVGRVRHAVTQSITPKMVEKLRFCLEVAHALEMARKEGFIDHLVLVAPPAFLGELKNRLTDKTNRIVDLEIPKDLTNISGHELRKHLPQSLFD
jgi:protein required for attachment to host cells